MKRTSLFLDLCIVLCLGVAGFGLIFYLASDRSGQPANSIVHDEVTRVARPVEAEVRPRLHIVQAPAASDSDEVLLRKARDWVAQSPEAALQWTAGESDPLLRERLLFAILRAWGEADPEAAVNWALFQDSDWRFKRMEAALTGTVVQPEVALAIGRRLLATEDATSANAYCTALVGALNRGNQFQTAFQFSADAAPEERQQWLDMTFRRWGAEQPQAVMRALESVDAGLRESAFHNAVEGWAASDPKTLVAHAATMPPGENRGHALGQAMLRWSEHDPAAMGEWLNTLPANRIFEAGAALLVTRTDGANRPPEVAMLWVQHISDPSLRHDALVHVVKEWAHTDSAAAWQYLSNAAWLSDEEKRKAATILQNQLAHSTIPSATE